MLGRKRVAEAAHFGRDNRDWYRLSRQAIADTVPREHVQVVAGALAATSVGNRVRVNAKLAAIAYHNWLRTGDPWPNGGSLGYRHQSIEPNLRRAFRGEELHGPKVRAFKANLLGDESQVTVDSWVARGMHVRASLSTRVYRTVADRITLVSATVEWTPAETQACLWHSFKLMTGDMSGTVSFADHWPPYVRPLL
jgi:hypothetical protein